MGSDSARLRPGREYTMNHSSCHIAREHAPKFVHSGLRIFLRNQPHSAFYSRTSITASTYEQRTAKSVRDEYGPPDTASTGNAYNDSRGFSGHLRHGGCCFLRLGPWGCTHPQRVLGSCLGSAYIARSQRSTMAINEETQKGETLCSIRSFLAMQNARTCNLTLQTRYVFMLPKSKLESHSLCR